MFSGAYRLCSVSNDRINWRLLQFEIVILPPFHQSDILQIEYSQIKPSSAWIAEYINGIQIMANIDQISSFQRVAPN